MSASGPKKSSGYSPHNAGVNPFARALAETEKSGSDHFNPSAFDQNPFSDAMSKTGGSFGDMPGIDSNYWQNQQEEMERQQRQEALRKKLHDQINPVDMTDVYSARKRKEKEEIRQLREELKHLALELKKFHKEIQITLMGNIADPGVEGTYHKNFFQQLRAFILLLRQKIRSARTWTQQMQSKAQKKKKRKGSAGLAIEGRGHEQTKTVFDMMHHERSSTYGGS
jgi:hypothetical protein